MTVEALAVSEAKNADVQTPLKVPTGIVSAEARPAPASFASVSPSLGPIDLMCRATPRCVLRPFRFFVSWQGVLTLAYSGFPPALLDLKRRAATLPGLPAEYSGSKWPKTSLACLRDDRRLSPDAFTKLNAICKEETAALFSELGSSSESPNDGAGIVVDSLSAVFYECRCLERRLLSHTMPLDAAVAADGSLVDSVEIANVLAIVSAADAPDYWFHVSKDGSREAHYRGSALGLTLVHDLRLDERMAGAGFTSPPTSGSDDSSSSSSPPPVSQELRCGDSVAGSAISNALARFRARVDSELGPDLYAWFSRESLHVTVRALMG